MLPFFGLLPDYRLSVFTQIHEIVFNGNGGYTWNDVYNMPIWLRKFVFKKLYDFHNPPSKVDKSWTEGETKQIASQNKPSSKPTYVPKASKK